MGHWVKIAASLITFLFVNLCCAEPTPPTSQPASDETNEFQDDTPELNTQYAQLQIVDKVTGRFKLINALVNKVVTYQRLKIKASVCRKSAPFDPPESKSFLTVWEQPKDGAKRMLFSGWMVASSPALSTLAHPRYSLWLVKCTHEIEVNEKK